MPGSAVSKRVATVLEQKYTMNPGTTLYGQSICPDEINNEHDDLATLMTEHWGEVFPMGGIGGAPYVGKTGFGAFASHVPDGGDILIMFGPHCGVSSSGELGKYLRVGQSCESSACGAVLAAYGAAKAGEVDLNAPWDTDDMQQSWLRERVAVRIDEIEASEEPLSALAAASYEIVEEKMRNIINPEWNGPDSGKLVLLGGVQINMPEPFEDHYQPLFFKLMGKGGAPDVCLLDELNTANVYKAPNL